MNRNLKKYFVRKYSKPDFKAGGYPGYGKLKSVAIVFDREMEQEAINFARALQSENKEVYLLGYIAQKEKEIDGEQPYDFLCKSDIKWHGAPSSEKMDKFLRKEYELFIDVLNTEKHPLDIISESISSHFKIGRMLRKDKGYNLTLDAGTSTGGKALFEEINYYIKFINKDK